MEAKRKVFKKEHPFSDSPFVSQSKPPSGSPQKKMNGIDSILKNKRTASIKL